MSNNEKDTVRLAGNLDEILAYNDPRLSNEEFERRLINEIFHDDVAIRCGTVDEDYRNNRIKGVRIAVAEATRLYGPAERNRIITGAYNRCSNSKPLPKMPYLGSGFLNGSDYDVWAKDKLNKKWE